MRGQQLDASLEGKAGLPKCVSKKDMDICWQGAEVVGFPGNNCPISFEGDWDPLNKTEQTGMKMLNNCGQLGFVAVDSFRPCLKS